MDANKIKIIIGVVLIIAALGIAYALDFSKWKEINSIDSQIAQIKSSIEAKKSYYAVMDSKLQALNDAGWSTKKDSIAINFDSSLFFTPKIDNFFKTIVPLSGMKLTSMTSSTPEPIKGQTQVSTIKTENGTEISKTEETTEVTTQPTTDYLSQLQGAVKKTAVNLNVTGTYSAFKNLLSQFQGQTRIVTIKSVAVSSGEDGSETKTIKTGVNNLSFSIILDVYSY
jgi:Tfp pilus assembly protein PilO